MAVMINTKASSVYSGGDNFGIKHVLELPNGTYKVCGTPRIVNMFIQSIKQNKDVTIFLVANVSGQLYAVSLNGFWRKLPRPIINDVPYTGDDKPVGASCVLGGYEIDKIVNTPSELSLGDNFTIEDGVKVPYAKPLTYKDGGSQCGAAGKIYYVNQRKFETAPQDVQFQINFDDIVKAWNKGSVTVENM